MGERLQLKGIGCLQGKHLSDYREQALNDFEDLSPRTLRRHREPHHLCVLNELEEDGYVEAPQFIKDLLEENEEVILEDDLGITPRLAEVPEMMDLLRALLCRAEEYHRNRDTVAESKEFSSGALNLLLVALGRHEPGRGRGWLWLIRRLLLVSLGLAKSTRIDGGQREANCRFLYARFLLEYYPDHDTSVAEEHLVEARRMANGLDQWRFREEEKGDAAKTLFSVICLLMRDMYLKHTRELGPIDPVKAMRACDLALKRAEEGQNEEKYTEALTEHGHCYIALKKFDAALDDFNIVLDIRQAAAKLNVYGICEALINVAHAFQKLKKIDESREYLDQMMFLAQENGLRMWQARALWRLGELMVRGGRPQEASPLLRMAYDCFAGLTRMMKDEGHAINIKFEKSNKSVSALPIARITRRETIRLQILDMKNRILNSHETVGFLVNNIVKEYSTALSDIRRRLQSDGSDSVAEASRASSVSVGGERFSSATVDGVPVRKSRKSKKRAVKEASYFLDGNDEEDIDMQTNLNNTYKPELSHIRCMYGISKGQELIEIYFNELLKANTSMESRIKIIDWKLNTKKFWPDPVFRAGSVSGESEDEDEEEEKGSYSGSEEDDRQGLSKVSGNHVRGVLFDSDSPDININEQPEASVTILENVDEPIVIDD